MLLNSSRQFSAGLFVTLLLITVPAYAVKTYKTSNFAGAHQIWFEAEDFDERNPPDDTYYPVVDEAGAFGQAVSRAGGAGGMIRWTFDISKAGGQAGTWYLWIRTLNPNNQSDYMLVEGHPGDSAIPTGPPFPGGSGTAPFDDADDRILEETDAAWDWWGNEEGSDKQLRNGSNTMYIFHRQGNNTVFWDVFVWTDSASYRPTDADYQNATPAPAPTVASQPDPKDGAVVLATWTNLSWTPATRAVSHNVYLGDNFEDVNAGTGDTFRGNRTSAFLVAGFPGNPYPDGLVPGTTYYWRIDEVNDAAPDSPWRGPVWRFSVPPKKAHGSSPADNARYIDPTGVTLSWVAGLGAKLHYVYFGDNFDTVSNATVGVPQATTSYTPAGPLAKGKTYYWRVDEFEGPATHKGDVWSFTTLPDVAVTDPTLIGWWTLDEGQGITAVDWSGHNNHGKIEGNAQWAAGYDGGALELDGEGARVIDDEGGKFLNGLNALTIALWIKSDVIGTDKGFIEGEVPNSGNDSFCSIRYDAAGASFAGVNVMKMAVTSDPGGGQATIEQQLESSANIQTTEWQHVAMTWENGGLIRLYVNGAEDSPTGRNNPNNTGTVTGCTAFIIGQGPKDTGAAGWDGLVDDVRVYNKALTADQIKQIMRGDLTRSWNPSPANGSVSDVVHATPLTWSKGDKASQHDVYLGTDRNAVANADASDTTGVYRGRQSTTSYTPPEGIQYGGGPYYWRIDEINTDGTITPGTLWSFSVASYILVEDFEAYNDIPTGQPGSNLVYMTWLDGYGTTTNGSTMGYPTGTSLETTNVHGGAKSVPLIFDNSGTAAFSEVERTFAAQNWAGNGIQTLSLWFHGDAANVPGQLYVKINGVKALYDGDASNLKREAWQTWNIDLASVGANLQSVTRLGIGIETKGAKGTLLLDDIRLYPLPRQLVTPVQPNAAGLIGHWTFDGNTQDSSGLGNHGTAGGGTTFGAGIVGSGAINLSGSGYVVIDGVVNDIKSTDITLAAWIKTTQTTEGNVFSCNDSTSGHPLILGVTNGNLWFEDNASTEFAAVNDDQWHLIAYARNGATGYIYLDGIQIGTDPANYSFGSVTRWSIGQEWDNTTASDFYTGAVDDARIYNYPLSEAEIAGLAGMTKPFDKPF